MFFTLRINNLNLIFDIIYLGLYMEDSYLPESIETLSISHISTQIKDLSADSLLSEPLQEELIKAKSLIDQVQIEQKTELA